MRKTDEPDYTAGIESQPRGTAEEGGGFGLVESASAVEPVDQEVSDRIANLAHDLRTPFVSIRGYTKLILEERIGPINSTQREYLTIVAENANKAIHLLNDLLQVATNQPLRLDPFDARDLWQDVLGLLKPRARRKSVRIREQISSDPLTIVGDREKLTEVLAELLSNAVKFTDQGGEIMVELTTSSQKDVMVRISRKGVEIPENLLDRIFCRPSQRETSTEGSRESLGTIHDIIRSHGGRISVSSQAGEGVTFLIAFPSL